MNAAVQIRPLTNRERQVLLAIAEGLTHKEIAKKLGITVKTIDGHVLNIKEKLGTGRAALLTRYAIREGLVTA